MILATLQLLPLSIPSPAEGTWYVGPVPVRAYALGIILGVVAAIWLGERRWVERGGTKGQVGDVALWAVPAGVVGARVYHVATDHDLYFGAGRDPWAALQIWNGGLGIWGAIAGGFLGAWFYCRRHGILVRPFDLATQDRRTLVFFGYTNCPDVCQIVMATMASALAKLSPAEREQLETVFVTTDPARDTPAAMRTYLDRFDPSFRGVTGSLEDIVALGKPLDILVEKGRKLPSGGYEVDHSTVVVSVAGGRGDLVWTGATSPADMALDLEKVLAEDAG